MRILLLLALCCAWSPCSNGADSQAVSLHGRWRFKLDRDDAGLGERWFSRTLPDRVKLPGTLAGQGIGDDISTNTVWTGGIVDRSWFTAPEYEKYRQAGNVKVPFWLQPNKYYKGAAWYQRDIEIPRAWANQRIVLMLERPHWQTIVWLNNRLVGTNDSLATSHDYDLGPLPRGKHTLSIRVDNRMIVDVGHDSHSVSDHTQGNWNGIAGRMELRAMPRIWIQAVNVFPQVAQKSVRVVVESTNASGQPFSGKLQLDFMRGGKQARQGISHNFNTGERRLVTDDVVELGPDAPVWDEFAPVLHTLRAELRGELGSQVVESKHEVNFGLREVSVDGTYIAVNGRKTFIRGTLECAIFPKTGHPPTDLESWRKVIRAAKDHGLNLLRFHSWCPPEAAFDAADELGMYFQVECSSWANSSTTLGDGKPIDRWIYAEADRILKTYGNHPSFLLMLYGNEPGGKNHQQFLAQWVNHYKARDRRMLFSSGAGWPQIPENEFHVTPDPRIQAWGGGLKSRINARPPETVTDYRDYIRQRPVPVISHEIGQWCVYPNFDETKKYTGYLKPKNFEIFRDTLRAHHLDDLRHKFLFASGKLQTLCYKEDIESALRTPGMAGFQLLDLHDFPGQGTALIGVLDPFWESKGYVTPAEYSRFCNSTVPLARLPKRVFTTAETLHADIEVAHFGLRALNRVRPDWSLRNVKGATVAKGTLPETGVPIGSPTRLGSVSLALRDMKAPAQYKLTVGVDSFENDWDIWVYKPEVEPTPSDIVIVSELDARALSVLEGGGKVLLLIPPSRVAPDRKLGKVALGFSSIFWNTAWTHRQAPHTLGILCDPRHPLFATFPTEEYSNWQWWYLVSRAGALILDDLPPALRPDVQVIDDWFTARRLGLALEAKLNGGKLMISGIDLQNGLETNVVARQFRHSLLNYMESRKFQPKVDLTADQVRSLYVPPSVMTRLGAHVVGASSEEQGFEAANVIDGDERTMWHSRYSGTKPGFPHEFRVAFDREAEITGFRFTPRQDNNRNGLIKEYEIYASADGSNWGEAIATGRFARDASPKTVPLPAATRARFFRVVAVSGFDSQPYASLAEFEVIAR